MCPRSRWPRWQYCRRKATWQNGCFGKMDDRPVYTIPYHTTTLQKSLIQIILAVKRLVRHSRTSPNEQRRHLPSLLSDSFSMTKILYLYTAWPAAVHVDPPAPGEQPSHHLHGHTMHLFNCEYKNLFASTKIQRSPTAHADIFSTKEEPVKICHPNLVRHY